LPEEGNHQAHTLEVFNATTQKVVKDVISYARFQANNTYYKEVLGEKINKKYSKGCEGRDFVCSLSSEQYIL
jgi:hypothetical protein